MCQLDYEKTGAVNKNTYNRSIVRKFCNFLSYCQQLSTARGKGSASLQPNSVMRQKAYYVTLPNFMSRNLNTQEISR